MEPGPADAHDAGLQSWLVEMAATDWRACPQLMLMMLALLVEPTERLRADAHDAG